MSNCKQSTAYIHRQASLLKALLLSAVLITGCASFSVTRPTNEPMAVAPTVGVVVEVEATPVPEIPPPTATVAPLPSSTQAQPAADAQNNTGDSLPGQTEDQGTAERSEPEIGEITFALGVTEDNQPVVPGLIFSKGITQVHALFEYQNMSPDYTWERVWYLNDREVSRSAGPWTGPKNGMFNYFINNSNKPLPAGNWMLEIHVAGKLHALGVFIIDDNPAAVDAETEPETVSNLNRLYRLAYTKCDGNHHNIYVADTNGHNQQLIVTRGAGPGWSPDGGVIFFYGEEGVDRQRRDGLEYVFNGISNGIVAVGASPLPVSINQLRLFQGNAWKQASARWASVSPDGTMVAFDARPGGDYRIYFLGAGVNEQQFRIEIPGEQADWSPDSQRIVYRSGRDGKTGIWISNRDDSNPLRITDGGSDSFPAWSPDGAAIAFSRDDGGNVDIYAVNVDGSNLRRLTTAPGHDSLPTYAPNGDIIFRSARTGSWGIWKMKGDGSEQTEIIPNTCVGNDWAYSRMDVSY